MSQRKATAVISGLEEAPKTTQETVLVRYRGEAHWTVDVSDRGLISRLITRGWKPEKQEEGSPYCRFLLPERAITIRSASSVAKAGERGFAARG